MEQKNPVEAANDGRFIVEPELYGNLMMDAITNRRHIDQLEYELGRSQASIEDYKKENERLHALLFNLTNSNSSNS